MAPSAGFVSRVEQILGPSKVHAVAAVRLYVSESNQHWEWTKVSGAVALASSHEPGKFLYVVDLSSNSILLSQEIYENFSYETTTDFFHAFEMDDCVAGLSFADTTDAKAFYQAVKSNSQNNNNNNLPPVPGLPQRPPQPFSRPPPPTPSPSSSSPSSLPPVPPVSIPQQPPSQPSQASPSSPQLSKSASAPMSSKQEPKKKGLFGKLMNVFSASDVPEDFVVSDPRGFRHESHIGWDPDAGFEIRNIPPEWRKLFQAAGVRKADLRDAETAKFVMNVIGETMLNPQALSDDRPPPPQPTSSSMPPPPPAPSGGGAPPPPPPPPPAPRGPPAPGLPSSKSAPPRAPVAPPARDVRGDLMSSIKQGTELRKVDPNEAKPLPDINNMSASESRNLVDTLSSAMMARRNAIQTEEEEEDEEWSD